MDIGHDLAENKVISRTSSQDAGVDASADVVVATSSLEVGYNDPLVGAVLQHKAPNDVASYLQRKGRAGRPRGMRLDAGGALRVWPRSCRVPAL